MISEWMNEWMCYKINGWIVFVMHDTLTKSFHKYSSIYVYLHILKLHLILPAGIWDLMSKLWQ